MRALAAAVGVALVALLATTGSGPTGPDRRLAQAGEREGQDPAPEGADTLPGSNDPGKRVGQDPEVPVGDEPVR